MIRVRRSDELLLTAKALEALPAMSGSGVGVLSEGGGHGTLATDAVAQRGCSVTAFEESTREQLRDLFPDSPNVTNPVDMSFTDVSKIATCAETVLTDPNVDGLLLCGLFGGINRSTGAITVEGETAVAGNLAELIDEHQKPIVIQSSFARTDSAVISRCRELGLPLFESIDVAASVIDSLADYGDDVAATALSSNFQLSTDPNGTLPEFLDPKRTRLTEWESKRFLQESGLGASHSELATDRSEARAAANGIGGTVAMKIDSPDIEHKTEVDGVLLDVDPSDAAEAYTRLVENAKHHRPEARVNGVLVAPMYEAQVEVIVGVTDSPKIDRVVMFGLGGIFAETIGDVGFRVLPLTEHDARELVLSNDGSEVLTGLRGADAVDVDGLVDLMLDVSVLVVENPWIRGLDLNPVGVTSDGVRILDATVHVTD